jgi:hypothetical protein
MRNDELILELANHRELQTTGTEEMLVALGETPGSGTESGPTVRCRQIAPTRSCAPGSSNTGRN